MIVSEFSDLLKNEIPHSLSIDTQDGLKEGSLDMNIEGIAVMFMATVENLKKAILKGANFIITHEPYFYTHDDDPSLIVKDSVYLEKRQLIDENNLIIWRFHDLWHARKPDGIHWGLIKAFGWEDFWEEKNNSFIQVEPITLAELCHKIKKLTGATYLKVVGDQNQVCKNIGLFLGSCGYRKAIDGFLNKDVDVGLFGETREWETCEYVRDSNTLGYSKSMIVIGHGLSEDLGMLYCSEWLQGFLPDMEISFLPFNNHYAFV